jgi:hypothetical protein
MLLKQGKIPQIPTSKTEMGVSLFGKFGMRTPPGQGKRDPTGGEGRGVGVSSALARPWARNVEAELCHST